MTSKPISPVGTRHSRASRCGRTRRTQRTNTQGTPVTATVNSQVNYTLDAAGNLTSDGLRTADSTNIVVAQRIG